MGQVTMSYFSSSRAAVWFYLTCGKTGEVVMEHKLIRTRIHRSVDQLLIQFGTQCNRAQRLCFPAGEHCRSMSRRQIINFSPDGTDFAWFSSIQATAFIQDKVPASLLVHIVLIFLNHILINGSVFRKACQVLFPDVINVF